MPKVSIMMATRNHKKFINQAIDSILEQSFKDWELIIVDDASDDSIDLIIQKYIDLGLPIKYSKNLEQFGIAKNRNKILSMCSGKYIAVLDSDDIWIDNNKLQKQYDFLESNLDYALIGTSMIITDQDSNELKIIDKNIDDYKIRQNILFQNQFANSSTFFLKKIALEVGGYDESLKIGEDYDLFLKIGKKYKFSNLKEHTIKYRRHSGSVCIMDKMTGIKNNLKIVDRYKNDYPNYFAAKIRRLFRYFVYKLVSILK